MAQPLVETKFHVPALRRALVPRGRLADRLAQGAGSRLTLVSAPAGFGKTTLLVEWLTVLTAEGRSVAWLSVDESDRQPQAFWTYLVRALQAASPEVGASAGPMLQSASAPIEAVLTTVLNDLRALPHDLVLVLDDYHLADGPDIATGMAFLLGHLPPQAHLVVSTRADPALPLARLRARGELVEVRAADLRFTRDEVTAYLNDGAGLGLAAADVAVLDEQTEGWVAALQLAALSMRGRTDVAGFLAGFAGNDRYVVDYLAEEVLARQPAEVRRFLLQTSLFDRLTGSLCDAVTDQGGGEAMLASLDRANLFVVPLDDRRHWYRYHHLFGDVLQTFLRAERSEEVPELHRRAGRWYEQQADVAPAVRHALAAGDVEHAAGLAELALPALRRDRREATIRSWLDVFPPEVVRVRPVLAVGFVGSLMAGTEAATLEARLQDVERWLEPADAAAGSWVRPPGMVVTDEPELVRLPGAVELYRTGLALLAGDVPGVLRHARLVEQRAAPDDHVVRAGAAALGGLALWSQGELEAAHRAYAVSVAGLERGGHVSDVLGCTIALADLRLTQGRLSDAAATCRDALDLAARQPGPVLRGTADMHVALSQIARERDDLEEARAQLRQAEALGAGLGLPQNPYRSRVAAARLCEADGDLDAALRLLEEAGQVYVGDFSPDVRPVAATRTRVLLAAGRLPEALAWADRRGLSAEDDLSYLREHEHLTLARVLLAQARAERSATLVHRADDLLTRLLAAARAGQRTGTVIEVLVVRALVRQAGGDVPAALTALEEGLTLAEPEGYVRTFTGEGAPGLQLLRAVRQRRPEWSYVGRLLTAGSRVPNTAAGPPPGAPGPQLPQPLSERELTVLRLLGSDLAGPDIARRLVVSVNTVRTHTKNIYAKLGVTSRRAAVRRGNELDLLSEARDR